MRTRKKEREGEKEGGERERELHQGYIHAQAESAGAWTNCAPRRAS